MNTYTKNEITTEISALIQVFTKNAGYLERQHYDKLKELANKAESKELYLIWGNSRMCDNEMIALSLKMWKEINCK